jgi:hypothetical protein
VPRQKPRNGTWAFYWRYNSRCNSTSSYLCSWISPLSSCATTPNSATATPAPPGGPVASGRYYLLFTTTAISGGTAKRHAPQCPWKTAVSTPLHAPLSTRLDEISSPWVPQSEPIFGPFGPPGRPRGPLPPSNCAKIAGAGALPLPAPLICFLCASWVPCSSGRRSISSS